jgi:DJ-1 family protein
MNMGDLSMEKRIAVILADGFEETEAVAPVDVWRRLGFDVVLAGLDRLDVKGSHGIVLKADCLIDRLVPGDFAAVFLPGGMPGSAVLRDSHDVIRIVREMAASEKLVCAICAAPIALGRAGVLEGKRATCYPGFESQLTGAVYTGGRVERDGRIVTGKGPGAVFPFAATVADALGKGAAVAPLYDGMFVEAGDHV